MGISAFFMGSALGRSLLFLGLSLSLSSCALGPGLQPRVGALLMKGQVDAAANAITAEGAGYGRGNDLLYCLDRGLVEHYAGRYADSIRSFARARQLFEERYTKSVSSELASWAFNDTALPYSGSDYELVLVNVFQAMNYLALGDAGEALVEARDLDSRFQVIADAAAKTNRQRYEDNGFARLFMGLVSEASGRRDDRNDALIYYKQALALYNGYYGGGYVPSLLESRLASLAAEFDEPRWDAFAPDVRDRATVIVFQLVGMAPVKETMMMPIPLEDGIVTSIAMPRFLMRPSDTTRGLAVAEGANGVRVEADTEPGVDIADLAVRDLEGKKGIALAKAVLRPALKYLIERQQARVIEKSSGPVARDVFSLVASLYNLYSEQADLRSWQTLPGEIRVARLILPPGRYHVTLRHLSAAAVQTDLTDLGEVGVGAGQTLLLTGRAKR